MLQSANFFSISQERVEISYKCKQIWIQQAKVNIQKKVHKDKFKNKNGPLIQKYTEKPYLGYR
jgi:hypothetical protein